MRPMALDLNKRLSPPQLEAATRVEGPVCILAGAGSGKTRVVTHRIAHLIENLRARPWQILAVTFTNKAAQEMRSRVDDLVPGAGKSVRVGTFHGTAARLLRRYGDAVGIPSSFVIYDQDDAQRLLKRVIVDELNLSKDLVRPAMGLIDGWQSEGLRPSEVPEVAWNPAEDNARKAYGVYHQRLAEAGAVDFGGLLVKLRDLLREPAGEEIKRVTRHLLVDEYQDTNRVQADVVMSLAKAAETIAVVGDDDQAIYGWRGATADNLKHFIEQMPGSVLVKLEDNYRSTQRILDAANGVIANNATRLGKTLRPTGEEGRAVRLLRAQNDIDEARKVVRLIQEHGYAQKSLDDVAVLYRTNAMSRALEDELRKANIPYRLVGGVRFYDRKEVKDVLATVRCALNPKSDVDTVRMLTAIPRGIGATSIAKLQAAATKHGRGVLEIMCDDALLDSTKIAARTLKKVRELGAKIESLRGDIMPQGDRPAIMDARGAMVQAIDVSGVSDRLEAENSIESQGRLENLGALVSAAAQYVEDIEALGPTPADPDAAPRAPDVLGFLEDAALLGGDEQAPDDDNTGERATLMTLHAAKGLEFDLVFLIGLEEHSFPHSRALREDADPTDLEEERRLAYVGITRAKERLVLSYAQRRMVQGVIKPRRPSRFLEEIPEEVLEGDLLHKTTRQNFKSRSNVMAFGSSAALDDAERAKARRRQQLQEENDGDDVEIEYDPAFAPAPKPAPIRRRVPTRLVEHGGPSAQTDANDPVAKAFSQVSARVARARQGPKNDVKSSAPRDVGGAVPEKTPQRKTSDALGEGSRVDHASFGPGTIVELRGTGRLGSALVRFDESASRVVILRYLQPLSDEGEGTSTDEEAIEEPVVVPFEEL